ncbi:MAG TPA: YciI family protein [Pyrinomonadaceae bacterium]|nr:YciI family protein [Pyrinomonadaceae bacterium]
MKLETFPGKRGQAALPYCAFITSGVGSSVKGVSMKKAMAISFLVILSLGVNALAQGKSQDKAKTPPAHKMVEFQMALLKRTPNWEEIKTTNPMALERAQMNYVNALIERGNAVIAGRLTDDGDIRGVYVLRAKSVAEAQEWADNSPAVKSGHLIAEIHPWWSEEVMKRTATPEVMTTAYLAFLTRGEKWTPEKTPQTEAIQKAHMDNINRLAETKKLVVAGPFGDNGTLRGIFVFKVASLDEARALAETDPAVQAGRLALDIHPWLVPEGILP